MYLQVLTGHISGFPASFDRTYNTMPDGANLQHGAQQPAASDGKGRDASRALRWVSAVPGQRGALACCLMADGPHALKSAGEVDEGGLPWCRHAPALGAQAMQVQARRRCAGGGGEAGGSVVELRTSVARGAGHHPRACVQHACKALRVEKTSLLTSR